MSGERSIIDGIIKLAAFGASTTLQKIFLLYTAYQRAKLHVVKVRRSISSNGGTRKKVDELLALYKPGVVSPAKK